MKSVRRIGLVLAAAVAASTIASVGATATAATPEADHGFTATMAPSAVWHWYYEDHFWSEGKCEGRGRQITDPSSTEYIPGIIAYACEKQSPWDLKWSMRVLD